MSDPGPMDATTGGPQQVPRVVPMRLQKFLARAGVASRRGSEDLMTAGRVSVNGVVVRELGAKVDPLIDAVTVDGAAVTLADSCVYLALHKPAGYVTTMSDPEGRPTVATLVPTAQHPGLFPVGRLDYNTTGLLLFTTDGELSHRLLHPRWKVPKQYRALVDGVPHERELARLREGIELDDGPTAPALVKHVRTLDAPPRAEVEITIREGRKRQVRRMFSAIGHPVLSLHRDTFGPVAIGELVPGKWRSLDGREVCALRSAVDLAPASPRDEEEG